MLLDLAAARASQRAGESRGRGTIGVVFDDDERPSNRYAARWDFHPRRVIDDIELTPQPRSTSSPSASQWRKPPARYPTWTPSA